MKSLLIVSALALLLFFGSQGFAASPVLKDSSPRGGRIGAEVKVTFIGERLFDTTNVIFHKPGFSVKSVKVIDDKTVEATINIAPDCELGEHHVRLLGKSGFSYARTFWVGQFPEVKEVEPNDTVSSAQQIELNSTVAGIAKPEDTDFYQINVKKGQRISVEMEALRLNNVRERIAIDPCVAILDAAGNQLVYSDDSALLKQDAVASIVAPSDGRYIIQIRDSAYRGDGVYRAHITTTPRPLSVYPAGGRAGETIEFTYIGDPTGSYKQKSKLPTDGTECYLFGGNAGQIPVSGNKARISLFENVSEREPNNSFKDPLDPAKPLPLAFNGILEKPGDQDLFRFHAKKDQRFIFRSYAARIGTPVDTVISIIDANGKRLGGNDDADNSKDSKYEFRCPSEGEYMLRVKDRMGAGGQHHVYRVESQPVTQRVEVTMSEMKNRDNQYRKQINIPQGSYYGMEVNVSRKNMSSELVFDLPELPRGVSWQAPTIPSGVNKFPILCKAEPNAPVGGGLYPLFVKSTESSKVVGRYIQTVSFVRGIPNGTPYYQTDLDLLPVAVTEKAPFRISIDQPKVPIVQNGTLRLKVRAHREKGFDKKITVRMLWKPPGISCPSTMVFDENTTELEYELNANSSAQVASWKIALLADANAGKGVIKLASPYSNLRVEEPYSKMKINMANVRQGETGFLHCDLEKLRDFEGTAEVQLFGLPANTTSTVVTANHETKEIRFPITTSKDSPVGQHKNLFCTYILMKDGEPIQHRVGMGGVLRIDPAKKGGESPREEAKKPLSRLEQLRQK